MQQNYTKVQMKQTGPRVGVSWLKLGLRGTFTQIATPQSTPLVTKYCLQNDLQCVERKIKPFYN